MMGCYICGHDGIYCGFVNAPFFSVCKRCYDNNLDIIQPWRQDTCLQDIVDALYVKKMLFERKISLQGADNMISVIIK